MTKFTIHQTRGSDLRTCIGITVRIAALAWFLAAADFASAFYDPSVQRWINRDPIQERGGINAYEFVANTPGTRIDPNGQALFYPCLCEATIYCAQSSLIRTPVGSRTIGSITITWGTEQATYDCRIDNLVGCCSGTGYARFDPYGSQSRSASYYTIGGLQFGGLDFYFTYNVCLKWGPPEVIW